MAAEENSYWYDAAVTVPGTLGSLLVALAVFFVTRHFSKKDANENLEKTLISTLENERKVRSEERRIEGVQEVRAALARMAVHYNEMQDTGASVDQFAAEMQKMRDILYLHYVYWDDSDVKVGEDTNTVARKWNAFYREGKLTDDMNAELARFLTDATKYFSSSAKGGEKTKPTRPYWWVDGDAVNVVEDSSADREPQDP